MGTCSLLITLACVVSSIISKPHHHRHYHDQLPNIDEHFTDFADLRAIRTSSKSTSTSNRPFPRVIKTIAIRTRRETLIQRKMDITLVKQKLNETLIATNDLKLRANNTYELLCKLKKNYLPHDDSSLNTCERFAERSINDQDFNIPPLSKFTFRPDEEFRQELTEVFAEALRVIGKYRFVVSTLTTMEENHLCNGASLQCGTERCAVTHIPTDDPFQLLCQLKVMESRVRALYFTLKRAKRALNLEIDDIQSFTISSPPVMSEFRRMMFSFGVTYQLRRQAETLEFVLRFVNNLEEGAFD